MISFNMSDNKSISVHEGADTGGICVLFKWDWISIHKSQSKSSTSPSEVSWLSDSLTLPSVSKTSLEKKKLLYLNH